MFNPSNIQTDLIKVLNDPELDAEDKLEAVRRMASNRLPCSAEQSEAILRDLAKSLPATSAPPKPPATKPAGGSEWLTHAEACVYAKCSRQTMWRWKQQGLPFGRRGRIQRSDLDAWLSGNPTPQHETLEAGDEYLTLAQAAERAGVSKTTLSRWGYEGLRIKRHGRIVRVRASVLEAYLKRSR